MNKITTSTACLWLLAIAQSSSNTVLAATGDILWRDEFDDDAATANRPNSEYWSYDTGGGGWGNGELQVYTEASSNVVVENGLLKIIARKDESSSPTTFTSGRIKTEDKISFKYGTLEARVKSPDMDAGLWPAFWTLGANFREVGWPKAGEIDIMELGQGIAIDAGVVKNRVVSAAHWDYQGNYATYAKFLDSPTDLTQDFHTYRLEWTPTRMATFVNDQLIWEMDIGADACEDCEELHQTQFILFNMAVGGGFTSGGASSSGSSSSGCSGSSSAGTSSSGGCTGRGPEDITAPMPAELQVDWVRLYDNGFTEGNFPSTPQPTTAPITAKPTNAPVQAPVTAAPRQPDPTPSPTTKPVTTAPRQPAPTPRPTVAVARNPPTLTPQASFDSWDGGDDDLDCFDGGSRSGASRSGGKAGKGGKGGKGGSRRKRRLSGHRRSRNLDSRSSGKGSKGGSRSGSSRSGCGRSGQTSLLTSHLDATSAATGKGSAMYLATIMTVGFLLVGFCAV